MSGWVGTIGNMFQKPKYKNHAGLRRIVDSLQGLAARRGDPNAFAEALSSVEARRRGGETPDMVAELAKRSRTLNPLIKRRVFEEGIEGVPKGLKLGWAQLPESRGSAFSLGVFVDRSHFAQVALADDRGRVFVVTDPKTDLHGLEPRFVFGKEGTVSLPYGSRFGVRKADGRSPKIVKAVYGAVAGKDDAGRMNWLASWLKTNNRYTLEQLRPRLPETLRYGLEFRDAIAIAFFSAYMLPQIHGMLIGFGSGNIFRRLNREAPMGAIRRCVRDSLEARAKGMRVSGLEDHFADLMREAGALGDVQELEPVHGAEPLHLYTSSYSGSYLFGWDSSLAFPAALRALSIEGNLNRFAAVSAWLERNASVGALPTEDTVTREQAAQIDQAMLANPALIALGAEGYERDFDPVHDDGTKAAWHMVEAARETARKIASGGVGNDSDDGNDGHANPQAVAGASTPASEWVYRQTLSTLVRRLRLPYRFDVDFRSNLETGEVALGFTSAGSSMMPVSRYDEMSGQWAELSDVARAQFGTAYNLRIGLMMAALAFGAGDQVQRVSLHIDSIGLEEAVAEQNSAISELMSQTLKAFERMRAGSGVSSAKAAPKDGDIHGDPAHPTSGGDLGDEQVNDEFRNLMQGIDLDETVFGDAAPSGPVASSSGSDSPDAASSGVALPDAPMLGESDADDAGNDDVLDESDPMAVLRRSPSVRNLVSVTFTRERFLDQLRLEGLAHPLDFYRLFEATMEVDARGGLQPVDAGFDLSDSRFAPHGSQEEPELADVAFSRETDEVLGCSDSTGLAIQREDLLQRAVAEFHHIAADDSMASVAKAHAAMSLVNRLSDPELTELAPQVTSALIDGLDTPELAFSMAHTLDAERLKARDLLFSGQVERAIALCQNAVASMDEAFARHGVPRYFNSYAERVAYNRLFATPDETTVLIPDNLFYAHMELADLLSQIKGPKEALGHLNRMVAYAPAYPLSHMKLAVQLARLEDWDSARAACLNALRVSLDRDDAAFAYYRLAYACWMRDEFDVAAAAYIMADHIAPGQIEALDGELHELLARADSQCIDVPRGVEQAQLVLRRHELPVWPHIEVASIVRQAARITVDQGMFVPARTLSVAAARMNDGEDRGIDVIQAQFIRSLSA